MDADEHDVSTLSVDRRGGDDRRKGERRGGRPPLGLSSSQTGLRLSADDHDRLLRAAAELGETVSEMHRRLLRIGLAAFEQFRTWKP